MDLIFTDDLLLTRCYTRHILDSFNSFPILTTRRYKYYYLHLIDEKLEGQRIVVFVRGRITIRLVKKFEFQF